jgi:spore coat protein A
MTTGRGLSRREFLRLGAAAGALGGAVAGGAVAGGMLPIGRPFSKHTSAAVQGIPLPGNKIPQFVDPLPDLHIIDATAGEPLELHMCEFQTQTMPTGSVAAGGAYTGTWVWGYLDAASQLDGSDQPDPGQIPSYIGPVIVAKRGEPLEIKYVNRLGTTGGTRTAWDQWTDRTLHWADPLDEGMQMTHYAGPIPAVPHLHGGEVPPQLDGGPDAWFTSDGEHTGHAYYSKDGVSAQNYAIFRYPNSQEAANIWFHDHALGVTRINVYAGLAGAYIITDPDAGVPANLPELIPLVIQDRTFDVDGQLHLPNLGLNPEHPFWVPEFVGDTIVVNGKVWPFKAVGKQRYRLLLLNGSNARPYDLSLIDPVSGVRGPRMWVIGTDGGYLDTPVLIDPNTMTKTVAKSLVMMPGERYEVVVDFADAAWSSLVAAAYPAGVPPTLNVNLRNTARTPYPDGAPTPVPTTGRIIQFRVDTTVPVTDESFDPASGGALRNPMVRLVDPATGTPAVKTGTTGRLAPDLTRQLTLNEVMGPGGPMEVLVNNTKYNGLSVATDRFSGGVRPDFTVGPDGGTYYSELPQEGTLELWEIINMTADAHPMHLHLVQFQLMNRQPFDVKRYNLAYSALFPGSSAIDPNTGTTFPAGVFIGGFGPPADITTGKAWSAVDTFNGTKVTAAAVKGGNPDVTPFLNAKKAPPVPPLAHEAGWKDTVITYPGEVTRIMVRWAPTDLPNDTPAADASFPFDPDGGHGYVWHCHIIDHEDNEMMRPDQVQANAGASRSYIEGTDF